MEMECPTLAMSWGEKRLEPNDYDLEWSEQLTSIANLCGLELEVTELLTREEFRKVWNGLPPESDAARRALVAKLG